MQMHPVVDLIFVSLHVRNSLVLIDPQNPDGPVAPVTSRGLKPLIQEFSALEYSAGLDSLVYYSAADGPAVYAIDWDGEAAWRLLSTPASLDPIDDAAGESRYDVNQAHTFGRFRVAHFDEFDLALLVRHVDSPVYAMRITR